MTQEEAREVVQDLLKENEPEKVAVGFYNMYIAGKIEFEDLEFLVGECGFDLPDEFKNASDEERKKMYEGVDDDEIDEELFEEDEGEKEPEEKGDDRASRSEGYDGEEVYDKKGNPTQTSEGPAPEEETDEEKAQKLLDVKF